MGYPKYDKEEAKRVYNESLKNAGEPVSTPLEISMSTISMLVLFVLCFIMLITMPKTEEVQPIVINSDIVIKKIKLTPGKHPSIIVTCVTDSGLGSWEKFETTEISYSVGDTVKNFSFTPY